MGSVFVFMEYRLIKRIDRFQVMLGQFTRLGGNEGGDAHQHKQPKTEPNN